MKKSKIIGLSIEKEGLSLKKVKLDAKSEKQLEKNTIAKFGIDNIKKHFLIESTFDKYQKVLYELIDNSIPLEVKEKCKVCLGKSEDESDSLCLPYRMQMELTFIIAADNFNSIICANAQIITDKKHQDELAKLFFHCFYASKEKGMLYFNLSKLSKYCLEIGFLSLSIVFSKNDKLKSLSLINKSIDKIETFQLTKNINSGKNIIEAKKQKKFFSQKRIYLEKELELEKLNSKSKKRNIQYSLKELFIDSKDYSKVINLIKSERLIISETDTYKWNGYKNNSKKEAFYECAELKSIQALGVNLKLKNYLKPKTKNNQITNALSNLFNMKIVESTYNRVNKELQEDSNSLYNKLFGFIQPKY